MTDQDLATAQPSSIQIIDRAIADPDIDPAKMKELLDIQERWQANQARTAFNASLVETQREMPVVLYDGKNTHTNSQYASLENVQQTCKKTWIENGFSIIFSEAPPPREDWVRVIAEVRHRDGHVEHYQRDAPMDNKGPQGKPTKSELHGCQSAVSYLRRNMTCEIFGITVAGQDRDGNREPLPTITEDQCILLREGIVSVQKTKDGEAKFCEGFGIKSLWDLPACKLARAKEMIEAKRNE